MKDSNPELGRLGSGMHGPGEATGYSELNFHLLNLHLGCTALGFRHSEKRVGARVHVNKPPIANAIYRGFLEEAVYLTEFANQGFPGAPKSG